MWPGRWERLVGRLAGKGASLPWTVLLVQAAACSLAVLVFNVSMLTRLSRVEKYLQSSLTLHLTHPPFNKRVLVSQAIAGLHSSGLSITSAFFLLQGILLFGFFLGMAIFCWRLRPSHRFGLATLILTSTSFPLLFIFIPPMAGWDDVLAWVVIMGILLLLQGGAMLSAILVTALGAILCRETVLLMLAPIGALLLANTKAPARRATRKAAWLLIVFAVLAFVGYELSGDRSSLPRQFRHLEYNFASPVRATESLYYLVLGLGVAPIPAYAFYRRLGLRHSPDQPELDWLQPLFATMAPLYLAAAIFCGRLREIRIMFPALIVAFPMAVAYLSSGQYSLQRLLRRHLLACTCLLGLCSGLAVLVVLNPTRVLEKSAWYQRGARLKAGYAVFALSGLFVTTCLIAARTRSSSGDAESLRPPSEFKDRPAQLPS